MKCIKFVITAVLAIFVSFFCACFSMGVGDMTEYNTRFPNVYAIKWDCSGIKKSMSELVGEEEEEDDYSYDESDDGDDDSEESYSEEDDSEDDTDTSEEVDLSELTAVVDIAAYRAIAIEVSAGEDSSYPTTTVNELAVYLYYEGAEDATISYGIFVSSKLPEDDKARYTIANITNSEESNLYENASVVTALSEDDMITTGTATLAAKDWTDIYATFNDTTITAGQYLIIVFFENNDYVVGITENTEQDNSSGGSIIKFSYLFTQYTTNDIEFSFDKVLLYVSEDDDTVRDDDSSGSDSSGGDSTSEDSSAGSSASSFDVGNCSVVSGNIYLDEISWQRCRIFT